jgi:hypothetical protein
MIGHIEVLADPPSVARHVAEWMTALALAAPDAFRVSLSGGSTPKALYELLASDDFVGRFPGFAPAEFPISGSSHRFLEQTQDKSCRRTIFPMRSFA